MQHSDVTRRMHQLALALALLGAPAVVAAQGTGSATATTGSPSSGTDTGQAAGGQATSATPGTPATGGTAGSGATAGVSGGYGDPNAIANSPPMGPSGGLTTTESGGDVDQGGGSKWGWLGLLGLLGLAGMRRRNTVVEPSTRV